MQRASNPWIVLVSVSLGMFMAVIDVSILNIALPSIAEDFAASTGSLQWTLIGYSLTLTGLVPIFGRISDVYGRRRLFLTGIGIFTLASLMAGAAGSIAWLIVARVIQAVGGAMITTNTLAIVTDTFPAGRRGVAMGVQAILISGGAAVGPTLGGLLVTRFGWQAVFYVNLPIGVLTLLLAAAVLPPLRSRERPEPIDWLGAVTLIGGLTPCLLALTQGAAWGWRSPLTLGLLILGIVLLVVFTRLEMRLPYPLIDMRLFQHREFTAGQMAAVFASIAMSAVTFLFPFYWQGLRGLPAQKAGIYMLPMPLMLMWVAPLAGRLSDRFGARTLATAGLAVMAAGMYWMTGIGVDASIRDVLWRLGVFGAGLGLFMAPNNNAVMTAVPADQRGVASGLLGTFRFIGQSLGVGVAGAIFLAVTGGSVGFGPEGLPTPESFAAIEDPVALAEFRRTFIAAQRAVMMAMIPLTGVGVVLSLIRGGRRGPQPRKGDAAPE